MEIERMTKEEYFAARKEAIEQHNKAVLELKAVYKVKLDGITTARGETVAQSKVGDIIETPNGEKGFIERVNIGTYTYSTNEDAHVRYYCRRVTLKGTVSKRKNDVFSILEWRNKE
jgi:uncharacterized protein YkvS